MLNFDENKSSLIEMFSVPKEYIFDGLWACTYSANERTIEELKRIMGVSINLELAKKWEKGEIASIYVQQGHYNGSTLPNYIHVVCPYKNNNPVNAHAKVYCVRYKKQGKENEKNNTPTYKWKLVVASANLTNSDELNVYAVFDGTSDSGGHSGDALNKSFCNIVRKYTSSEDFLIDFDKCNFGVDANKEVIWVDENIKKQLEDAAKNAEQVLIISPFFDVNLIEEFVCPNQQKFTLVSIPESLDTNSDSLEKLKEDNRNLQCMRLPALVSEKSEDKLGNDFPSTLHAKIYVFKQGNTVTVYIGSANATYSAFNGNYEVMIKLEEQNSVLFSCDSIFEEHTFSAPKPGDKERKEFEKNVRSILASFQMDKEKYTLSSKIGYEIRLSVEGNACDILKQDNNNAKELNWKRVHTSKHIVEMTVSKDSNVVTEKLMVEGEPIRVNEDELKKQVRENVCRAFKFAKVTSGESNSSKKESNSISNRENKKINTLHSVVCSIKNVDEAEKFEKVYQTLKEQLDEQDRNIAEKAVYLLDSIYNLQNKKVEESDNE